MKLRPITWRSLGTSLLPRGGRSRSRSRSRSAFTLAESLAALTFLAVVVPVAIQALNVATKASVVAQRKMTAARFADRWLNELLVTGQWKQGSNSGTTTENGLIYRWQLRSDSWETDAFKRITLTVNYAVQGRDYEVQLATLMDPNAP